MSTIAEKKSDLRKSILLKRDELSEECRIESSLKACENGLSAPPFSSEKLLTGTVVSGFFPIRSEIDARPLMFALAKRGARLCVPVVMDKTTIIFRELLRDAKLVDTGFGAVGPDESAEQLDPDIMLVPLSAFDARGARMGYGAGYYDRAIGRIAAKGCPPMLLGVGFSVQQVETVPTEPHDRFLDGIITEEWFIPTKQRTGVLSS